jgi:hypothetical protein
MSHDPKEQLQVETTTRRKEITCMTTFRIKELESLDFQWDRCSPTWEDRLSELADYSKIHAHCNVSRNENPMLNKWAGRQRNQYKLYREGKISSITPLRIQTLEILDFEWDCSGPSGKTVSESLPTTAKSTGTAIFIAATATI